MTDFTREIKIRPSYDHRDDPSGRRGAHGCDMLLILTGELGAITAEISTGWMARPLAGNRMIRGVAQARRGKPGIDARLVDQYPSGSYVGSHSPVRRGEYDTVRDSCDHLGGAPCFSDGSLTAADRILEALVSGGSDAAFQEMSGLYRSWLTDRPPYRPELQVGDDDGNATLAAAPQCAPTPNALICACGAPVNHTSEPTQPPPRPQEAAQQPHTATHSPTTGPNQGRTLQGAHKPAHDRNQT